MSRLILVDTSSRPAAYAGTVRVIDMGRKALEQVLREAPARRFVFNSHVQEVDGAGAIPEPAGGTLLTEALQFVAPLRPDPLVVISDGVPNDRATALDAARALSTTIRTIFVGPDADHAAIACMRQLARCSSDGMGTAVTANQALRLVTALRHALIGSAG